MSLEQRLKVFNQSVARNLNYHNRPSYVAQYRRLVFFRRFAETILSAILVFGGQQFVIQNNFFSPIWPAAGVGLSAIFLRGNRLLWGIFLGAISSYLLNHYAWLPSLIQSVVFIFTLWAIRELSLRFIGAVIPLPTVAILWKFIAIIALLTAIHTFSLRISGAWFINWLAEINGILCLTPLCLIFTPFVPAQYFHLKPAGWWLWSLIIIVSHLLYFWVPNELIPYLALGFLLSLCLYAKLYGQIPTCFTLLGLSIVYLVGVMSPILFISFTITILLSLSIATYQQQKSLMRPV